MAKKELNWHRKSWFNIGNDFSITVKNPITGEDGPLAYQIYGVTDDKWQNCLYFSESGVMHLHNDGPLEIHTGGKNQGGINVQISTSSGDITITANKNGAVRIRSSGDMTLDCDGKMTISAGNGIDINGGPGVKINATSADVKAKTGNLLPEGESFTEKCYAGSKVGSSAVKGFNITSLLS